MREKLLFAWSTGKDSAMALYELERRGGCEISALLTTVTQGYERVSMHGVRCSLLEKQACSLRFLLEKVVISKDSFKGDHERRMRDALVRHKEKGVGGVVFGDIFLEDLKKYREDNLAKLSLKGVFPLWKKDTDVLARSFIKAGFRAIITCVDARVLDGSFAGRLFDEDFLADLPAGVDPSGENGEFHTFVYDGPLFAEAVLFKKGETVLRDSRYFFCDLL